MSNDVIGFIPPQFGREAFGVVFWSFLYALREKQKRISCLIPENWSPYVPWRRSDPPPFVEGKVSVPAPSPGHPEWSRNIHVLTYQKGAIESSALPILSAHFGRPVYLMEESRLSSQPEPWIETMPVCFVGLTPSMGEVIRVKNRIGSLVSLGLSREQIRLVLFCVDMPGGLPLQVMTEELGPVHFQFPFDPRLYYEVENRDCLLQYERPKSGTAKEIVRMAEACLERDERMKVSSAEARSNGKTDVRNLEQLVTTRLWTSLGQSDLLQNRDARGLGDHIDRALHEVLWNGNGKKLSKYELSQLKQRVEDHVLGLGPLEKFLRDESITEIMANGERQIFLEKNGQIHPSQDSFLSEAQMRIVIDRIVGRAGRRVDHASPLCNVRLSDGSRANIILPPVSLQGPVLTIRRFKQALLTFDDLLRLGSLRKEDVEILQGMVRDRKNILIAGNSGSGKTTFLNILSRSIRPEERIVTLEDTAELQLQQPHVVRFETRAKNADGEGEVTMKELVINALRMRPDRIIIGECRGDEVIPMLQALNTGHDGSMATLHANSAEDALQRLESMVLLGAPQWPIDVIRQQIGAGIDAVVYLKRQNGVRRLEQMVELAYEGGTIKTRRL